MTAQSSTEIERTFEISEASPVPDLTGLAGIATVRQIADEALDATCYDTADFRLIRSRTTLRRRRGGRDAGWHLKLPLDGQAREEVTLALGRSTAVPEELRTLVLSRTRGAPLAPVVRLRTARSVRLLLDSAGNVLAELADDRVVGQTLGAVGRRVVWRELEVELVEGDQAALGAIGAHLLASGARVSARPSKLARTLEGLLPVTDRDRAHALPRRPTAAQVVHQHLLVQIDELVRCDPDVRRGAVDAVHKMRVATRRLRSALRTYRPLLEPATTSVLCAELKHLAAVLGEARDAEVLREHLLAVAADLPQDLIIGSALTDLEQHLGERCTAGMAMVNSELAGERYIAVLEALEGLAESPPWRQRAHRPAAGELRRAVGRAAGDLDRAAAAAKAAPTLVEREELLHDVRKTAKQARYVAESTLAVVGGEAARFARRAERIQAALGEHQDSGLVREQLAAFATGRPAGQDGFTLGVLYGGEQVRADRARIAYVQAWQVFSRPRTRRWLG